MLQCNPSFLAHPSFSGLKSVDMGALGFSTAYHRNPAQLKFLRARLPFSRRTGRHRDSVHRIRPPFLRAGRFILPCIAGPDSRLRRASQRLPAYGDFAAGATRPLLALLTIRVRPAFWLFVVAFNFVGAADPHPRPLSPAIQASLPARAGALGAAYAIVVIYVPLLMITHCCTAFYLLVRSHPKVSPILASDAAASLAATIEISCETPVGSPDTPSSSLRCQAHEAGSKRRRQAMRVMVIVKATEDSEKGFEKFATPG